ncbi:hypothetical protein BD560DRAFT_406606 [Blakeslea trispora]|nr:hypothetical protein BD560DRAFT_406606 [Blakeslea trispora]
MKREALKLYDNYFNHNHQEKAVVSLGLNSILDLTRSSPQKQLLSDQWDELQNLFGSRFRADFEFEGELLESIKEIEMVGAYLDQ